MNMADNPIPTSVQSYTVDDIVRDVNICIDEIAENDAEFETQDDSERRTIIISKITEAMRFVYRNAEASLLEPSVRLTEASNGVVIDDNGFAVCQLPGDYLRLVYARMSSWARAVGEGEVIQWTEKEYSRLSDPYCTGTPQRPKVAIAVKAGRAKYLELYTGQKNDTVLIGIMTDPKMEDDADIGDTDTGGSEGEGEHTPSQPYVPLSPTVYRAIIYYIAGLVFVTYADEGRARMMFNEANDLIGFTAAATNTTNQ